MAAVSVEVTVRQLKVVTGTDVTDVVLATVAGTVQAATVNKIADGAGETTYEIVIVHLNA